MAETWLPRAGRQRAGSVMVLVLVVVVILGLAGYSFVTGLSTQHKSVRLHGDLQQSEQVLGSAEAYLRWLLTSPDQELSDRRRWYHDRELFCDVPLHPDAEHEWHAWRFTILSPRVEAGLMGELRYGLGNCSARLHLARVMAWEAAQPGAGEAALLALPGVTPDLAQSLLDWLDSDDEPRERGGERDEYAAEGFAYAPRNGLPESLDELLLVRGMTRELLYGGDLNQNFQIDPEEEAAVGREPTLTAGQARPPLSWFLTLHAAERNQDAQGLSRIDLNQPDLTALRELLQTEFGPEVAEFVVAWRQYGPAPETGPQVSAGTMHLPASPSRGLPRHGHRSDAAEKNGPGEVITGRPTLLTSPLDLLGARVQLPDGRLLDSPWRAEARAAAEQLDRWLDRTAVTASERIEGRINVDWAPREVLRAVPTLSDAIVDRILGARRLRDRMAAADQKRTPLWLWQEGLVDLTVLQQLWPYITSGGDIFQAQVIAFSATGGPYSRVHLVFDGSQSPPRRIYWEDLRPLGLGFSSDVLTGRDREGASQFDGEFGGLPTVPADG